MPYICFKCKRLIPGDAKCLFSHLHLGHNINSSSTDFQCCEEGCNRRYSFIRSYRRHIQKEHEQVLPVNRPIHADNDRNAEELVQQVELEESSHNKSDEEWDKLTQEAILDRVALFIAHLKSRSSQTFSSINYVVQQTSSLIDLVGRLQTKTMSLFSQFGHDQSPQVEELRQEFFKAACPFKGLETDDKQMKYFTNTGNFIQPIEESFPNCQSLVQQRDSVTGSVRQDLVTDTFQRIPLKQLLVKILELPGILHAMIEWQQKGRDSLQDIFDGQFCKTHPLFMKEVSIPLLLYFEDCETVNPFGSKTGVHKLGFIYLTLNSLPQNLLSSLQSHFLLAVYESDDAKTYGIDAVLRPIVEELGCLERDGITVDTPNFQGVVKFSVVQVVGDSFGLSASLGYMESFTENPVCCLCRVHRDVLKVQTREDPTLLRDANTHKVDLLTDNPSQTGLKGDSILNRLSFYHVTDNTALDVMHDILEGVGPYEVKLLLNSLIQQKLITLDELNHRITSFDYGFSDEHNKPSIIGEADLKNLETPMRQSAAQMWCLLRLLPVLIGDLVPTDNQEWQLLLLLLMCMEILFSPSVTPAATRYLSEIIEEHHSLFMELFSQVLRPEHHSMIHYPRATRMLGPLIHLWVMRFEAKHGFFKRVGHIACNFRNICKTMAYRHQIMQCYSFMCGSVFSQNTEVGPGYTTFLANLDCFKEIQCGLTGIPLFTELYVPVMVTVKDTTYRPGMTVFMANDQDGEPQFGLIKVLLVLEQTVKLVVQRWETLGFEKHFFAYQVLETKDLLAIDVKELLDHHPLHAVQSYRDDDDTMYISLRYRHF